MSWIDIAGTISATRYCSKTVVTASIDDVHFLAPVHKGDIVCLTAQVNYVHNTSMEVGVKVVAEDGIKNTKNHTVTAYLTFVALDHNLKPVKVPFFGFTDRGREKTLPGRRAEKKMAVGSQKTFYRSSSVKKQLTRYDYLIFF